MPDRSSRSCVPPQCRLVGAVLGGPTAVLIGLPFARWDADRPVPLPAVALAPVTVPAVLIEELGTTDATRRQPRSFSSSGMM